MKPARLEMYCVTHSMKSCSSRSRATKSTSFATARASRCRRFACCSVTCSAESIAASSKTPFIPVAHESSSKGQSSIGDFSSRRSTPSNCPMHCPRQPLTRSGQYWLSRSTSPSPSSIGDLPMPYQSSPRVSRTPCRPSGLTPVAMTERLPLECVTTSVHETCWPLNSLSSLPPTAASSAPVLTARFDAEPKPVFHGDPSVS